MLSVLIHITLCVRYAEWLYAQCHYTECHYADSHGARITPTNVERTKRARNDDSRGKNSTTWRHDIFLTCHFVNMAFCQLVILSTCHFVNLPFCQLAILSTCHFVNLPFCQLVISSTCHFINLSFCSLVFLSTEHLINLLFSQHTSFFRLERVYMLATGYAQYRWWPPWTNSLRSADFENANFKYFLYKASYLNKEVNRTESLPFN